MTAGPCSTDKPPALEPCTETACPPGWGHVSEHEGGSENGEDRFPVASQPEGEDCPSRGQSKHKQKRSSGPGKPPPTGERAEGPQSLIESCRLPAALPGVRGLRLGDDAFRQGPANPVPLRLGHCRAKCAGTSSSASLSAPPRRAPSH